MEIQEYVLSDRERAAIQQKMSQIQRLSAEIRGILELIHAQQGLQGAFELSPDAAKLVKVAIPGAEKGRRHGQARR